MAIGIIGVSRGCGLLTLVALVKRGEAVRALARNPERSKEALPDDLDKSGIEYRKLDVTGSVEDISEAINGCSAVVFAASATHLRPFGIQGNHPQSPRFVDCEGVEKLAKACVKTGVKRMVLISSADADRDWLWINMFLNVSMNRLSTWKARGEEALKKVFREANEPLGENDTKWNYVIVRPVFLRDYDSVGPGMIRAHGRDATGYSISRKDVAEMVAECAASEFPKNVTFNCSRRKGQPKDGHWDDKGDRKPVPTTWGELMQSVVSLESMQEEQKSKKPKTKSQ